MVLIRRRLSGESSDLRSFSRLKRGFSLLSVKVGERSGIITKTPGSGLRAKILWWMTEDNLASPAKAAFKSGSSTRPFSEVSFLVKVAKA